MNSSFNRIVSDQFVEGGYIRDVANETERLKDDKHFCSKNDYML